MSALSNQVLMDADRLPEGAVEPTYDSFEDALGASMSAEEVAQTKQMLDGAGAADTEHTQEVSTTTVVDAAPAPQVPAPAPAAPAIAPEVLALFQQQQAAYQQQQAMLEAMAAQNAALVKEFQAARAPAPPPDNTPEEVKQFKQQLWQEWEAQHLKARDERIDRLEQERAAERANFERQQRTQYFVNQAQSVADQAVLSDIDPSLRGNLAGPVRDLILTVAAAMAKPPAEVAPVVKQMAEQLADAKIKTLQMQAKARVAKNAATPPQPQLRAASSGDGFDPTKVSDEELHKMGAKDPLDAVFMARRKGLL